MLLNCGVGEDSWEPGLGRSPGEGNSYPLQYSWRSLAGYSPWGCKESDTTEQLTFFFNWWNEKFTVYVKAVYWHPAYLTYMQSTSWEMLGWRKHKLESRLPGEIAITSGKWYHPYGRKQRRTKEPLDESERGEWNSWVKAQHSEN